MDPPSIPFVQLIHLGSFEITAARQNKQQGNTDVRHVLKDLAILAEQSLQ